MKWKQSPRFKTGIDKVRGLEQYSRYQAAFVFGSVAEGTSDEKSDLDVLVLVDQDNDCKNVNHPTFDNYKLDISFHSFEQIEQMILDQIKQGDREPILVRGVILFDKIGKLTKLQKKVQSTKPQKYKQQEFQFLQFMLYHANNKVERVLKEDPVSSLYSMHANIGEVLKIYFKLNGRWWVSSKNVLNSLDNWDKELASLVKDFVAASDVIVKYKKWTKIIDHVAKPLGGRLPIAENNCDCTVCRQDLAILMQ